MKTKSELLNTNFTFFFARASYIRTWLSWDVERLGPEHPPELPLAQRLLDGELRPGELPFRVGLQTTPQLGTPWNQHSILITLVSGIRWLASDGNPTLMAEFKWVTPRNKCPVLFAHLFGSLPRDFVVLRPVYGVGWMFQNLQKFMGRFLIQIKCFFLQKRHF